MEMPLSSVQLSLILTNLSVALGLSVVIERLLEIFKYVFGYFATSGSPMVSFEDRDTTIALAKAEKALDQLHQELDQDAKADVSELNRLGEFEEDVTLSTVLYTKANDPDDGEMLKVFLTQLFGFAFGIVLSRIFDLHLFQAFLAPLGSVADPESIRALIGSEQTQTIKDAWKNLDILMTGLFIGGGAKPVHIIMRFITKRKVTIKPDVLQKSEASPKIEPTVVKSQVAPVVTPVVTIDHGDWVDISYEGGVDRDKLGGVHRRRGNPELIVFHHTAMHSQSRFEDVYRAIKGRGWSTGYHCVVTADGGIHPFCRWDRYGNHAKGNNLYSLGISFNGNFETKIISEGTNAGGRYGNRRPTEDQLMAGARVIALWTQLYGIDIDFNNTIRPHRDLKQTACPGSSFPVKELEEQVKYFNQRWEASQFATNKIDSFKKRPYIYFA